MIFYGVKIKIAKKVVTVKLETLDISSLVFDPNNARKHSEKNLEAIKGSLTKFGQQKPIVVDKKNVIVAGNGTVAAAKALGWTKIQAVRTELDGFMQSAFALADNRTAELAEWDMDTLKESLNSLDLEGFDVGSIGFTDSDVDFFNTPEGQKKRSENKELNEEDFSEFEHQCPRCGFEFNDGKNSKSSQDGPLES